MRLLTASAVLLLVAVLVPEAAGASHGELHGPSMSPLLVELAALAGGLLAYLLRHPAARLAVRAEHAVGRAFRSVFEHGFHRVRSRHS